MLIKKRYPAVDIRRIIHSSVCRKKPTNTDIIIPIGSGATLFSSACEKCLEIMKEYPPEALGCLSFSVSLTAAIGNMITTRRFPCSLDQILLNQICFVTYQCFLKTVVAKDYSWIEIVDIFSAAGNLVVPNCGWRG